MCGYTGALPDASATLRKAATKPRRRTEAEKLALFAWDERVRTPILSVSDLVVRKHTPQTCLSLSAFKGWLCTCNGDGG